jgi:hypothetical protein
MPNVFKRVEIQLLDIVRRRFQHDLKLIVVLQAIRVFAVAAIRRTAAGLHIGGIPSFRSDGAQKSGGVKSARAHLHVQRLQHDTATAGPVLLQGENQPLEGGDIRFYCAHNNGIRYNFQVPHYIQA